MIVTSPAIDAARVEYRQRLDTAYEAQLEAERTRDAAERALTRIAEAYVDEVEQRIRGLADRFHRTGEPSVLEEIRRQNHQLDDYCERHGLDRKAA